MTSPRATSIRLAAGATVALLALAGCGDSDDGATPTQTSTTAAATPSDTATSPSTSPSASPSQSPPSPSASPSDSPSQTPTTKPVVVKVTIKAGEVLTGSVDVPVLAGDRVRLIVKTDVADELHAHGAEQTFPLTVGKNTVEFQVPVDLAPGVYEVETHEAALLLFNFVVP